ncbi:hypothetical protein [uncultured Corynebacterium sp.]|uniref:hypothetical protein n=1 Tax=uncultured Corynebacterium sp. TaxID=159447 RepID=UPI002804F130|nr:hypothetical protein [uncultured Corynebacterium sp.]
MKFFSRKALVAAATAATVSLSGVSVASAEDTAEDTAVVTNESADSESNTDNNKETDNSESENDNKKEEESSSSSSNDSEGSSITDMSPREIRDWIAVFTAIIGALGTVFAFYQKNFAPNAK